MWGRIAGFAEKLDSNFGDEEGSQSQSQSQGDDSAFNSSSQADGVAPKASEESSLLADDNGDADEDGWGEDDDFDDSFDFGEDDPEPEPIVNGGDHRAPENEAYDVDVDVGEPAKIMEEEPSDLATAAEIIKSVVETGVVDEEEKKEVGEDVQPQQEAQPQAETLPQCAPQSPQVPDQPSIVTVSAPGKALIAGGYLVLESPNPGVVLAAEGCRFHTTITFKPPYSEGGGVIGNSVDAAWESIPLDVYSPQFDRVFSYYLSYSPTSGEDDEDVLRLQPRTGPHEPNKFVERSLLLALGYLRQSIGPAAFHERLQRHEGVGERVALAIKLRADNDFYSQISRLREQGLDLTPHNLEQLEPFLPCPKDPSTGEVVVNKTGMGSSAALVTSIVGALLRFFGAISLPSSDSESMGENRKTNGGAGEENVGLTIAHNLSQICHCHAQGKVGSGFDVSSAIYGSHVYTRFSKSIINDFLECVGSTSKEEQVGDGQLQLSESLSRQLVSLVNDVEWDCTVQPISLPPGLELLMADVCGGSESPSMARKVLEWKKKKRQVGFMDDYYWKDLKRCNRKIVSLLSEKFTSQTFLDGLRRDGEMIISMRTAEQWKKPMPSTWYEFDGSSWDVALKLLDLRMAILECRQNLKGMGKAAGVPIEPDEQSVLADVTMKLPGVVAAGVPGAGGHDALFVIYVKGPSTNDGKSDQVRDDIGELWKDLSDGDDETVVCPLSVRAAAGSGGGLYSTKLDW